MKKYNFNITFFESFTDTFSRVDEHRGEFRCNKEEAISDAEKFIRNNGKNKNDGCHVYAESYEIIEVDAQTKYEFTGELTQISDYEDWDMYVGDNSMQSFMNRGLGRVINGSKVKLTIEVIE